MRNPQSEIKKMVCVPIFPSCSHCFLYLRIPFPDLVDRWINQQLKQEGGKNASYHGCGNSFHYVRTCPNRPHDRNEAEEGGGHGHELWPEPLDCSVTNRLLKVGEAPEATFLLRLFIGEVKIEKHEDTGFGIHTEECDQSDPHPDAHVVAEEVKEPEGANGRKRHGQQNDEGLGDGPGVEIEEKQDQKEW